MTKEELGQYRALKLEIKILQDRISRLEESRKNIEHSFVKGSNPYYPYQPQSFHVSGYNITADVKKEFRVKQLKIMLEKKKSECEEELLKLQEYINSIPDSNLRVIFTMTFVNGLNYDKVGSKLHMDRSTIGKKIINYLNKDISV